MTRKLKALGLALFAVFALGALTAGSAFASGERFHSEAGTTIVTGVNVGNHVFASGGLKVTCTSATFKGTQSGTTSKTLTLHPEYSGCSDNVFGGEDTVDTVGCNYVFESEKAGEHLPAKIECTASNKIIVTAPGCALSFGEQTTTNGVVVTNEGSGSSRDVKANATAGATYSKSGGLCFLVSGTSGTYTGTATLKGYVDTNVTGNIDEGATYTEGAQVGVWWE